MRRLRVLLAVAAGAALAGAAPAGADTGAAATGSAGAIQMTVHTHSSNPATLLYPDVQRLPYDVSAGDTFAYSSRLCSVNAVFNNVALDFRPSYPGVDDATGTASVRHRVAGAVTGVSGDTGTLEGTITTVRCEDGMATDDVMVSTFTARFRLASPDQLRVTGTFAISPELSGGTFAGLEGQGSLSGVFTCLGSPVCADLGEFTDFVAARGDLTKGPGQLQPGLVGSYSDPTVTPA